MAQSFVLCERAEHVDLARSHAPDSAIVAITPEAAWFCQRQQIQYVRLDDFVSSAAMNEVAEETLRREYAWAKWMDHALGEVIPEFATTGFTPAKAHLYFLKRTFDNLILPARVLLDFAANAKPSDITVFERSGFCPDMLDLPPERPIFALLAPVILQGGAQVKVWPELPVSAGAPVSREQPQLSARIVGRKLARAARRIAANLRRNMPSAVKIAWISGGYDMAFAVPFLRHAGAALLVPPGQAALAAKYRDAIEKAALALKQAWDRVSQSAEFWQVLDPTSPALRSLVEPFLKRWVLQEVPLAWGQFLSAREWLESQRLMAVAGVEVQAPLTGVILNAAGTLGLHRVASLHNGPGGAIDLPVQDCLGLIQSDVYLVNGSGDVEYFESFDKRLGTYKRAITIAAGSARLEALRMAKNSASIARLRAQLLEGATFPLLLYIPTQLLGCYRYFNEGYISDVAYLELQQRILKRCAEFPNVRILYKPFSFEYATNPMPEFIAKSVPNGRTLAHPLGELIWAVDAIIVDFPSTPLNEVLLTDKPVIAYADRYWARMLPQAKQALQKRALVSETPEEFEEQVACFLAAGNFAPIAHPDNEFLRLYGTHLDDGRSAQRAADIIVRAARDRSTVLKP